MVAILDGTQVDDGTAWEIGYHYSSGGKIIGIRTDFRRAGETNSSKVNAMIECSCLTIVGSLDHLVSKLKEILEA
jgi:nucleoside 2-deoxyribosyltransferase